MNHNYDGIMDTLLTECNNLCDCESLTEVRTSLTELMDRGIRCFENFYSDKENSKSILSSYEPYSKEGMKLVSAIDLKPVISKYEEYASGMQKFVFDIFALSNETASEVNESVDSNLEKAYQADGAFVDSIFGLTGDTKVKACTMSDNFSDAIDGMNRMYLVKEFLDNNVYTISVCEELTEWRRKGICLLASSVLHYESKIFSIISNQLHEISDTVVMKKEPVRKLIYKSI